MCFLGGFVLLFFIYKLESTEFLCYTYFVSLKQKYPCESVYFFVIFKCIMYMFQITM